MGDLCKKKQHAVTLCYVYVKLQFSSILTWHLCAPYLCEWLASYFTTIEMTCQCMRIMWASLINVSLITNINKSLKTLLNINLTVHASINGFNDTSMDNSKLATLSMGPRKWIITLHSNYRLTSFSMSCRHTIGHHKCCNCWQTKCCTFTTMLKWQKLLWAHATYTLTTNDMCQQWYLARFLEWLY